jgi:hypothetical protein
MQEDRLPLFIVISYYTVQTVCVKLSRRPARIGPSPERTMGVG